MTVNAGARPWTTESARLVSPSCANALLRIASIRPVRPWREATVKLHASYSEESVAIFARVSAAKIFWYRPRWERSEAGSLFPSRSRANQLGAGISLPAAVRRSRSATMKVWPSARPCAGWMSRSVSALVLALASISAQISWRLPVAWSITTIGWRLASERLMSVSGTAPVRFSAAALSSPGMWTTIELPGLNPSLPS